MTIRILRGGGPKPPGVRESALTYARQGLRVLPCRSTGSRAKAPYLTNGVTGASCDEADVALWWRRWPDALIGVAVPQGVVVLDIDPRNGASRSALEAVVGPLPETVTVTSRLGDGGAHLYYRKPEVHLRGKVPGCPGVDVLQNGYAIAPPSRHPLTGRAYTCSAPFVLTDLPMLPERAVEVLMQGPVTPFKPSTGVGRGPLPGARWTPRRAATLIGTMRHTPEHSRHDFLHFAASRVVENCPSHAQAGTLERLAEAAMEAGLDSPDVWATINSVRARSVR